jgi:tetratricopeptide (TPR) repeat protein
MNHHVNDTAGALNNLGHVAHAQGDYGRATTLYEECLALYRELGDKRGIAYLLDNLGYVAYQQGDYGRAAVLHEEALSLRRELGDSWGIASSLGSLGLVAYDQGDYGRAVALYKESLAKCREIGNKYIAVYCLAGLAAVVCAQGQLQRAAQLFGAAEATRGLIGAPLPPSERPCYERLVTAVRTQLDKETFAAAWAAGRALSLEQAIAYALAEDVARGERYDTVVATPVNVGQALEPPQPPRPGPVVLPPPPSDRAPRSPYKGLRPFMAAIGAIWP